MSSITCKYSWGPFYLKGPVCVIFYLEIKSDVLILDDKHKVVFKSAYLTTPELLKYFNQLCAVRISSEEQSGKF